MMDAHAIIDTSEDAAAIKGNARSWVRATGQKILIPTGLARRVREIGAWDDESMVEEKPLPVGPGSLYVRYK